jgi:hypothetical protein
MARLSKSDSAAPLASRTMATNVAAPVVGLMVRIWLGAP